MVLKGVNLGSWLLMEGYILGGRNVPEIFFKKNFKNRHGQRAVDEFETLFRDNFIVEEDFYNIAEMGANCLRLPFNFRLINKKDLFRSSNGFSYLKKAITLAHKYNLGVILDLHAAPGAQNCDWHADSGGKALFWEKRSFRERAICIWEEIAEKLKDEPSLIGYDIVNEPVLGDRPLNILTDFYKNAINRIKAVDKKHRIFLEGDLWAQRIGFLEPLICDNVSVSIHTYQPLNYTFNFRPFYRFPGHVDNEYWDAEKIKHSLCQYFEFSRRNCTDIFVGEFGINWRGGYWGELDWLNAMLGAFEEFGFSYTYWTYKAISGYLFPDGLYQYISNNKYIKREGPILGWENYIEYWDRDKKDIASFLQTKNFTPNEKLISMLKSFFTKK